MASPLPGPESGAPLRVLGACVAEDRPDYVLRVENLLISWRSVAALRDAPFLVNVVDGVGDDLRACVERRGAELRVVPRLSLDAFGLANKLRMLELDGRDDFDVLLAIDCDVVVVGDPLPHLPPAAIGAAPADRDPLTRREWLRLWRAAGIAPPARSLRATASERPMYPYFNSGVLSVPRDLCAPLRMRWVEALELVDGLWRQERPPIAPHKRFYSEQWALMIALQGLPWAPLPSAMNFPTHIRAHRSALRGAAPAILHVHGELDAGGFLLDPATPAARPAARRFNEVRAAQTGRPWAPARVPRVRRLWATVRRRAHRAIGSHAWYLARRLSDAGLLRSSSGRATR